MKYLLILQQSLEHSQSLTYIDDILKAEASSKRCAGKLSNINGNRYISSP